MGGRIEMQKDFVTVVPTSLDKHCDFQAVMSRINAVRQYPFIRQGNWHVQEVELKDVVALVPVEHRIVNQFGSESETIEVDFIGQCNEILCRVEGDVEAQANRDLEYRPTGKSILEAFLAHPEDRIEHIAIYRWGHSSWDDGTVEKYAELYIAKGDEFFDTLSEVVHPENVAIVV